MDLMDSTFQDALYPPSLLLHLFSFRTVLSTRTLAFFCLIRSSLLPILQHDTSHRRPIINELPRDLETMFILLLQKGADV